MSTDEPINPAILKALKENFMTKTTNEILERIRELADLKRLEFGCEIIVAGIARDNPGCERDVVLYGTQKQRDMGFIPTEYYGQVPKDEIQEIIGLPVHLEHLLLAIGKDMDFVIDCNGHFLKINDADELGVTSYEATGIYYDLTLSVEQNLTKNEDLRKLLTELLFDTEQ